MDNGFSEIMRYIKECDKASMLIAIDGRCAAGKTTLAALLKKEINCNIIHMDDFFSVGSSVPLSVCRSREEMWIMKEC